MFSVYFVAATGSDQAAGTLAAPFATIQHAASLAQPGDLVLIGSGTYRETVTPARSGLAGKPITFAAYDGEGVIISGADPVAGWSDYQGATYQASMPWDEGAGQNQVFVDGQPLSEARWPAAGPDLSNPKYASADDITPTIADGLDASTAILEDAALTQPAGFWDGATIRFSPGQAWAFQTGTVTSSSPGSLTFSFTSDASTRPYSTPSAGDSFALIGAAGVLDGPGEFNRSPAGALYVQTPAADSPANHDVEAQHRQYGFDLSGLSNIHVIGVTFFADTIATNAGSHGLLLEGLSIQYPNQFTAVSDPWTVPDEAGNSGLALYGSGNDFKDSTLDFAAGNGVLVDGSNNTVQGCTIHDTDLVGGNFAGIIATGASASIFDNVVYNTGRDGIRISSGSAQVVNNVVHDAMLQTTDGGGIYTFGTDGSGSEIGHNLVYSIHSGGFGAAGIYLDNYDRNWTVDNNTVWDCDHALKLNPPNTDDRIESNSLAGTTDSVATSGAGDMPGTVFSNNTFTAAANIAAGATETNDIAGGSFAPPADPAPDATLAAQHGSFTPLPNPGAAIAADEQKLKSDQAKLASDTAANAATLASDKAAVRADLAAASAALVNDRAAARQAQAAASRSARAATASDKAAISGDTARMRADRRNSISLAADAIQLTADRGKLAADTASTKAAQRAASIAAHATIASDQHAIHIMSSGTSPKALKLKSDTAAWATALVADQQAIIADQAQLSRDEVA